MLFSSCNVLNRLCGKHMYYNQCNGYNTILLYSEVSRPVCILAGPMVLCRKFYQIPFLFHYM